MHHRPGGDCHEHQVQAFNDRTSGFFAAPDHEYPSFLELVLTATDPQGPPGFDLGRAQPETVDLSFTRRRAAPSSRWRRRPMPPRSPSRSRRRDRVGVRPRPAERRPVARVRPLERWRRAVTASSRPPATPRTPRPTTSSTTGRPPGRRCRRDAEGYGGSRCRRPSTPRIRTGMPSPTRPAGSRPASRSIRRQASSKGHRGVLGQRQLRCSRHCLRR